MKFKVILIALLLSYGAVSPRSAVAINCNVAPPECAYQCDQVNSLYQGVVAACGFCWACNFYWTQSWLCARYTAAYNNASDDFMQCLADL